MATELQLAANRLNALKSTGPRTLSGKAVSSRNAVTHGLTAEQSLLPGETREEFQAVRQGLFSQLLPQGILENQLVERAASLIWRLRRFPIFENAVFAWLAHLEKMQHDGDDSDHQSANPERLNDFEFDEPPSDFANNLKLGRMLETFLTTDIAGRFGSYEAKTQSNLRSTLAELREMQRLRIDKSAGAIQVEPRPDPDNDDDYEIYNGRRVKKIGPP